MYREEYYKKMSEVEMKRDIEEEGFNPTVINNSPNFVYSKHSHPETKLLAIISGSIEVTVEKEEYTLTKGDKLVIPGNITHSAKVGDKGCKFFWSEKVLS